MAEQLNRPDGAAPGESNCGVVAVAYAAGRPVAEVMTDFRRTLGKSARWRGGTSHAERLRMLDQYGVRYEDRGVEAMGLKGWKNVRTGRRWITGRKTLETTVRTLKPGATYMIRVTGHVVTVRAGQVMDQGGCRPVREHRARRQLVSAITLIEGRA